MCITGPKLLHYSPCGPWQVHFGRSPAGAHRGYQEGRQGAVSGQTASGTGAGHYSQGQYFVCQPWWLKMHSFAHIACLHAFPIFKLAWDSSSSISILRLQMQASILQRKMRERIQWRLDLRAGTDSFPGVPLQGRRIPLEPY
jgi:hypothetical protein